MSQRYFEEYLLTDFALFEWRQYVLQLLCKPFVEVLLTSKTANEFSRVQVDSFSFLYLKVSEPAFEVLSLIFCFFMFFHFDPKCSKLIFSNYTCDLAHPTSLFASPVFLEKSLPKLVFSGSKLSFSGIFRGNFQTASTDLIDSG